MVKKHSSGLSSKVVSNSNAVVSVPANKKSIKTKGGNSQVNQII
jgi:hypothetical protein